MTTLGSTLIQLFGALPEAFKAKPAEFTHGHGAGSANRKRHIFNARRRLCSSARLQPYQKIARFGRTERMDRRGGSAREHGLRGTRVRNDPERSYRDTG